MNLDREGFGSDFEPHTSTLLAAESLEERRRWNDGDQTTSAAQHSAHRGQRHSASPASRSRRAYGEEKRSGGTLLSKEHMSDWRLLTRGYDPCPCLC